MIQNAFKDIILQYLEMEKILEMQNYMQHRDLNLLEHSIHVSLVSYSVAKKLNMDHLTILKGAMLHDFFLYDWHEKNRPEGLHGFMHPSIALKNAQDYFELSPIERDIILKHMWPLTLKPPRYKESILVCFVDKYCSFIELINPQRRLMIKRLTQSLLSKNK